MIFKLVCQPKDMSVDEISIQMSSHYGLIIFLCADLKVVAITGKQVDKL